MRAEFMYPGVVHSLIADGYLYRLQSSVLAVVSAGQRQKPVNSPLNSWLHQASVTKDEDSTASDQPEDGRERGGPPEDGNANDEQTRVE